MRVAMQVTEGVYQGYHGIEKLIVTEDINSYQDACTFAEDVGWQLIEEYGLEEEDEYYEEGNVEIDWVCYKIRDEITLSTSELDREIANLGFEWFVQEYCEKEALY